MGGALQDEVADGELRCNLHAAATAALALGNGAVEYITVQEDQRNVTRLIERPSGRRVGREQGKLAGSRAGAHGSPVERALELHMLAVVDAIGRHTQRGEAHVDLA